MADGGIYQYLPWDLLILRDILSRVWKSGPLRIPGKKEILVHKILRRETGPRGNPWKKNFSSLIPFGASISNNSVYSGPCSNFSFYVRLAIFLNLCRTQHFDFFNQLYLSLPTRLCLPQKMCTPRHTENPFRLAKKWCFSLRRQASQAMPSQVSLLFIQ